MDSGQKPGKRTRISNLFKRKEQTQRPQTTSVQIDNSLAPSLHPSDAKTGDRQRTRTRYFDSAKLLEDAVRTNQDKWGSFDFPELKGELEDFDDSQFKEKLNTVMDAWKTDINDQTAWAKCRHAVQCAFTAFSPFAKHFLTIAKDVQAITDKEIGRKEEFERALEYLSQQFAYLEIVNVLPDDLEQREFVANRALDVRSAAMTYLAFMVGHNATPLGTPGKVAKTFFLGDVEITDSKAYLDDCVQSYSRSLHDIVGIHMIIKVWEIVKGIASLNLQNRRDDPSQIEDNFLVPYQANPRFIGRTRFLQTLKEKLFDIAPRDDNHRIALYGMGGIGKTQCALGYVYTNRGVYDRIYWISAVDQTSLLSGYQNVAKAARLPYLHDASPIEIANTVLSWLRRERSWLLVIDNLDDIKVANGLLPENGSQKHTIITTRNPNAEGIPAKPLEVPLLDSDDSIDLLLTLSKITVQPDSPEEHYATEIVRMLGYLPLAIEQAAAYVREVTADFSAFLEEYERNHKKLYTWVPAGNRQYANSLATTWSMSFSLLEKYPAKLLRLFSLLNPDCIRITFLLSGAEALQEDLQHIISDQFEMAKALLELEKLSLIKWDRPNKSVTIHRLVQMVVIDQMSDEESRSSLTNVTDLFTRAFPKLITNETRSLCRMYQEQMVEPLLRMKTMRTSESALIKRRVGEFLYEDGKYDDSEKLLLQAVETYASILGTENINTLSAMLALAMTYNGKGRNTDAAGIQEQVLEKCRKILGEEHLDTLTAMHDLADTYVSQGRYADAVILQEQVLERRRRILGEEHTDTLTAMNDIANTYVEQGRYVDAAEIREQVSEKRKKILGEEHPKTLVAMNNLATTYLLQAQYADAAEIHEQVLEKRRRILGEEHPHTIFSMYSLAVTYQAQGRYADAADIHEQVLEKRTKILGQGHPQTLMTMHALAQTNQAQGRYANAAEIQEQVLEKRRRILGEEHPDTLRTIQDLGYTYHLLGRYADAAEFLEQGSEKRASVLGEEHPETLAVMLALAHTYQAQGRNAEAAEIQEQVLEKSRRTLGEEHMVTLAAMYTLSLTYHSQGRYTDAAGIHEDVLEKGRRILGDEHPHMLRSMHAVALTYQMQGRITEAAKMHEQLLEKRTKILGEGHPETLMTMHALAHTYQALGRYADAAEIQGQVLEKRRRILGEEHPDTLSSIHALDLTPGRNANAAAAQEQA